MKKSHTPEQVARRLHEAGAGLALRWSFDPRETWHQRDDLATYYKDPRLSNKLPFMRLVPSNDTNELASHLRCLLGQPQNIPEQASRLAVEQLNWPAVGIRIAKFLQGLVFNRWGAKPLINGGEASELHVTGTR